MIYAGAPQPLNLWQQRLLLAAGALITVLIAVLCAVLFSIAPVAAALPLAAVVSLACISRANELSNLFCALVVGLLAGYAFLGRGFAHIGHSPIYVSEAVLSIGLLVILVRITNTRLTRVHWLLVAFMALGLARTLPFVQADGFNTLRDGVVWGYAVFAIALSTVVKPSHLSKITAIYGKLGPAFLVWVPILFALNNTFLAYLPTAPGSDVQIPYFQPGDVGVHLAGIAAFAFAGLYTYKSTSSGRFGSLPIVLLGALWVAGFLIVGSINRGAFVACLLALAVSFLMKPSMKWLPYVFGVAAVLAMLLVINPKVHVEGRQRNISVSQALRNATSVVGGSNDAALEPTREWRLQWWKKIIDYTVFGRYFWTGKGFGVNLADDDGFQVYADHSLRSPHNSHFTILARTGVPGFALWVALNGVFVASLIGARARAKARGDTFRASFIIWLLIYWLAMTVNGSFTLYLEAPQEGIWFWTVFGLGLVVIQDDGHSAPAVLGDARPLARNEASL